MKKTLLQIARNNLSVETRRKLARLACWPPVGLVRFGSLRRRKPISADWELIAATRSTAITFPAFWKRIGTMCAGRFWKSAGIFIPALTAGRK